jgi:hypothetical protein
MELNNIPKTGDHRIADLFKELFSLVYINNNPNTNYFKHSIPDMIDLPSLKIFISDIYFRCEELTFKFISGSDGDSEVFLKSC